MMKPKFLAKFSRSFCNKFFSGTALILFLLGGSSTLWADWRDDVGYTQLIQLLGPSAPNGAGVPISLVEAQTVSGGHYPNVNHSDFSSTTDPLGGAVTFTDGSNGAGNGNSSHALDQARRFFGNTLSAAPGANQVTVYEAGHYLNSVLRGSSGNSTEPIAQNFRVQNFSWIGTYATSSTPTLADLNNDREALRRFDFVIDRDNITAFVGIHNSTVPHPRLLGQSYNALAVGRSSGVHSSGLTNLTGYGVGRSKPDIVAPEVFTSNATSITSSVATFLHSSDTVLGTDAVKSQTMKAILMAGASKNSLPETWSQLDDNDVWHPLDGDFGAGELNAYNSYLVTLAGQGAGSTTTPNAVSSHGWDFQTVQAGAGNEVLYDFVIPTGSTAAELSIILTWNAKILAPFNSGDPIVADLNLELVDSLGTTIDLNTNDPHVDGLSASDVDNVEHLYLTGLAAGTYTLKVSSEDLDSEYGLAWRTTTGFDTLSADFNEDGGINGSDFLAWQSGYGTLVNATHAMGDADGDGDVDAADLAIFQGNYGVASSQLGVFVTSVPEPTAAVLILLGLLLFTTFMRPQVLRDRLRSQSSR